MFQREVTLIGEGGSVVTRTTQAVNHGRINRPTRAQEEVPDAPVMYPKRVTRLGGVAATIAIIRLTRAPDPEFVGIARRPKEGRWAQSGPGMNSSCGYSSPTATLG
jgi:hypothetical protein